MSAASNIQPMPVKQPSPELFFNTATAFEQTAALKAAVDLSLFTAIADGAHTKDEIAHRVQANPRGVRILCDYLTTLGFLSKHGQRYENTDDSNIFLNRHSEAYLGDALRFLNSQMHMDAFQDLAAAVRKGGTVQDPVGHMAAEHPIWAEFARGMAPLMRMPAAFIARTLGADSAPAWKVLDIAAGHGVYGITLARHNPQANIYAVDWPHVLEVAKENAHNAGVLERYHTIEGSAFQVDFGKDFDVVLLTGFMHHFDAATNVKLLRKIHAALKPGGRVAVTEFVPNDDRITPKPSAQFPLTMLASTQSGDAYTFAELQDMFHEAGFRSSELFECPPPQRLVVATR